MSTKLYERGLILAIDTGGVALNRPAGLKGREVTLELVPEFPYCAAPRLQRIVVEHADWRMNQPGVVGMTFLIDSISYYCNVEVTTGTGVYDGYRSPELLAS